MHGLPARLSRDSGSLHVVGTGILAGGHLSAECEGALAEADDVLYLTADPASAAALVALRPDARSLADCYAPGRRRDRSYAEMVRRMMRPLDRGRSVCAAFYGHPGVFASAPHEAIVAARERGHEGRMLPAVSAEDCLFADLELDPAVLGWQSFEASDFLLRPRRFDPRSALALWQIGAIGVADYRRDELWDRDGLVFLAEVLLRHYPANHEVVLYEAAQYAVCEPRIERLPLGHLAAARASVITTLYVPPSGRAPIDPAMRRTLGLSPAPTGAPRATRSGGARKARALHLVGIGYGPGGQATRETRALIDDSERIAFLVSDVTSSAWIRAQRPDARDLASDYRRGEDGLAGSRRMVRRIVRTLDDGHDLCVVFSGHPAIYLHTSHAALEEARAHGHAADFLPAVSFEGCLFADLGIDPAPSGRLLYEATDFLIRPRAVEPTALLVLLQVGAIGETAFRPDGRARPRAMRWLAERLATIYPPERAVVLYRSARLPWLDPEIVRTTVAELSRTRPVVDATLVVPPARRARRDPRAARRLGLSR